MLRQCSTRSAWERMWKVAGEIEQLLCGRDRELVKTSLTAIYIGKAVGSLNLVGEESRLSQE